MSHEKAEGDEDLGEVVRSPRVVALWAWVFPLLAAMAAGWLLWSNWKSQGPEIQIRFDEAPGIQAGKSLLIYRGVTSGRVTGVRLDPKLEGVLVSVRLQAFAADLARSGTDFWIDKPVVSLTETSGLDAIIQGNSIQARQGGGQPARSFQGLTKAPLRTLREPSLALRLRAEQIPFLGRGTPVYFRGVSVGFVRDKELDEEGRPFLRVIITEKYAPAVRTTSRFWILPATSLKLSARGASLDMAGLDALVQGGIAFDHFEERGGEAADENVFELEASEFAARAHGPPITITFDDALGLAAGETKVVLLGQPAGLVEKVKVHPDRGQVTATARLLPEFAHLAGEGAAFTLVRPRISLQGVSGLETLVTGPYIAMEPGNGAPASTFAGRSVSGEAWDLGKAKEEGLRITLTAEEVPNLSAGAPVIYRGLVAGSVLEKSLDAQGRPSLVVFVKSEFAGSVRGGTRFWRVPATSVRAGPGVLEVELQGLAALAQGGVAFENFGEVSGPAAATYPLLSNRAAAAASSPPVRISFDDGQGLLAGKTELRYLGLPVGLVEQATPRGGQVEVVARFQPGHDALRRAGAVFAIVRPQVSLKGFTGLETLLSGVYIECLPGSGPLKDSFVGRTASDPEILQPTGFKILLVSAGTEIHPGAEIYYRDIRIGEVTSKELSADGKSVELSARIRDQYRDLIRENSQFWDDSLIQASVGFVKLKIKAPTLITPNGRVGMATPGRPGPKAPAGTVFQLGNKAVGN